MKLSSSTQFSLLPCQLPATSPKPYCLMARLNSNKQTDFSGIVRFNYLRILWCLYAVLYHISKTYLNILLNINHLVNMLFTPVDKFIRYSFFVNDSPYISIHLQMEGMLIKIADHNSDRQLKASSSKTHYKILFKS